MTRRRGAVKYVEHFRGIDQITLAEYERRVELTIDDCVQQIQTVARSINRAGPKTARELATEFESLDELH